MKSPTPKKRLLARILILVALFAIAWFVWRQQQKATEISPETPSSPSSQSQNPSANKAPAYVLEVLNYIRKNGQAKDEYVGGREFQNKEKRLPAKDAQNKRIRYSEWDVHPKIKGQTRGPERLVTGSDHSAYYTKDHYKTFLKLD